MLWVPIEIILYIFFGGFVYKVFKSYLSTLERDLNHYESKGFEFVRSHFSEKIGNFTVIMKKENDSSRSRRRYV